MFKAGQQIFHSAGDVMAKDKKAKYIGQCDRLRMASAQNEANWQDMMRWMQPISVRRFLANVDMSALLDDGDTAQQYIAHAMKADKTTNVYLSTWGGKECYFLQSAGFEFIFVSE